VSTSQRASARIAALALALTLCAAPAPEPEPSWVSPAARDHPLVGRIRDLRSGDELQPAELMAALARHRLVLLGEKHDNADHHRLQSRVVRSLARSGERRAVAFEMLSVDLAEPLERALAEPSPSTADLRVATAWDASGWPDWMLYAPVFEAALDARLPILPAAPPRALYAEVSQHGIAGLESDVRQRLRLDADLPDAARSGLVEEIREAHCGMAPEDHLNRMVDVQRLRDAHMASVLREGLGDADGGVLVAGIGHVGRRWGVPWYLEAGGHADDVAILAFAEVPADSSDESPLPEPFGQPDGAYDYVWFTPRVDEEDPCEKYRDSLERLQHGATRSD
jgi:uncharacterized iron-regulated protein